MNHTVRCTGQAFSGLTDPYTGEPLVVVMTSNPTGIPKFSAPDAYSPSRRYPTPEDRYAAWCRSEGIDGARSGEPIVCAYTGEQLVPKSDEYGFFFEGGFDPRRFHGRAEFLYYASMRAGVSKFPLPEQEEHVGVSREKPDRQVLGHSVEISDEAMGFAEQAMRDSHFAPERKTRVSMSVPRKNRRGR